MLLATGSLRETDAPVGERLSVHVRARHARARLHLRAKTRASRLTQASSSLRTHSHTCHQDCAPACLRLRSLRSAAGPGAHCGARMSLTTSAMTVGSPLAPFSLVECSDGSEILCRSKILNLNAGGVATVNATFSKRHHHRLLMSWRACSPPRDSDFALGRNEFDRPLEALPKAHLHLHLPAAMRRSLFEELAAAKLAPGGPNSARLLAGLQQRISEPAASAAASGNSILGLREDAGALQNASCSHQTRLESEKAGALGNQSIKQNGTTTKNPSAKTLSKYERRAAWLREGCPYPKQLDTADLPKFDATMPHAEDFSPDASLVWDVQWAAKWLLEESDQGSVATGEHEDSLLQLVVRDLVADARAEGVWHTEVMTGMKFDGSTSTAGECQGAADFRATCEKWGQLFAARRRLVEADSEARKASTLEQLSPRSPDHGGGPSPHLGLPVPPLGFPLSLQFVIILPSNCKTSAQAERVLDMIQAVPGYARDAIAGFGYFGGEAKLLEHRAAFAAVRAAGFRLVCVHAGEGEPSHGEGPARVRDALAIGAERIGHGIEAAASEELMAELKARGVCLEVCPLSNRALGCCLAKDSRIIHGPMNRRQAADYPMTGQEPAVSDGAAGARQEPTIRLAVAGSAVEPHSPTGRQSTTRGLTAHPLRLLLDAGVDCALAADDPLYWAADGDGAHGLLREFRACRELMRLDDAALASMAAASFRHSSAPPEVVKAGLAGVQRWLGRESLFVSLSQCQ